MATHPLELIHMDFHTIESGKTGEDLNVLVRVSHQNKIFDFTLLTFITVVLKSKELKEIFSKFLDSILIPPQAMNGCDYIKK